MPAGGDRQGGGGIIGLELARHNDDVLKSLMQRSVVIFYSEKGENLWAKNGPRDESRSPLI